MATSNAVYLIFTRSFGILQKTADNIAAARAWATRALPGEVTQVTRTTASVNVAELEAEWHEQLTRAKGRI